jgi:hypothetical protein
MSARRLSRQASRGRERDSAPRAIPGLALSSGLGVVRAGRAAGHEARPRSGAGEESRMLQAWETRCARTLPARSGRLADEPARILGPVVRGRGE